ncbi:MAG: hypothetical protein GQ552_01690, partial [Flavobacteriaceae bacterium]|nr:hypothetical protein [Flavobacteriaceae bacterium]
MKNFKYIAIVFVAVLGFVSCKQNTTNPEITIVDLQESLTYLASDSLQGRLPGSPGGILAGEYIANKFKTYGIKTGGENGYFQNFEVVTKTEAPANENTLKVGEAIAELNKDYTPFSYSTDGTLEADVVFAGYGFDIDMDSLQWNDYKNVDVKGKWVLVLRNDPEIRNPNSFFIPYSGEKSKVLTAKEKGAKGILLVAG